jgi:hypothetical protein
MQDNDRQKIGYENSLRPSECSDCKSKNEDLRGGIPPSGALTGGVLSPF